jgi:biopolymer transport protein ExbB
MNYLRYYRAGPWLGKYLLAASVCACVLSPAVAQSQLSTTLDVRPTAAASGPPSQMPVATPLAPGNKANSSANPYGFAAIWRQGDWVAKGCLLLLAIMSMLSWYALLAKTLALCRLKQQATAAHAMFADVRHFASEVGKLSFGNPVRFVSDAGTAAVHQYAALKPRVDYDTWVVRAIEQALSSVQVRMQSGMAVLATIGSTAPFVGLFGTVWAIYTALVKIGASGQASIDRVAGPVGEALIMTAIGLAVAVPAVFGYNWLLRQNKLAFESLRSFGAQLHGLLLATTDVTATLAAFAANPISPVDPVATPTDDAVKP